MVFRFEMDLWRHKDTHAVRLIFCAAKHHKAVKKHEKTPQDYKMFVYVYMINNCYC